MSNLHALWCVGSVCVAIRGCLWFLFNFYGSYCLTICKIPFIKSSRWPSGLIKTKLSLDFDKRDSEICNSILYANLTVGCGNKVMVVVRAKFLGVDICDNVAWRKRVNIPPDLLHHMPLGLVVTHNTRIVNPSYFPHHYVSQSHRLRETQQTTRSYSPYKNDIINLLVVLVKHLLHVKLRSSFYFLRSRLLLKRCHMICITDIIRSERDAYKPVLM